MAPKSPNKSPLESYLFVINHRFETMAKIIAANSYQPDYRPTFGTAVLFTVMVTFACCCLFTMSTYDTDSVIQCSTLTGIVFQSPAKFRALIIEAKRWCENHRKVIAMYQTIERSDSQRLKAKTERFARFFRTVIPVLMGLVWLAAFALILNPVVLYVSLGIAYSPVLPSYVPFVNEKEVGGYALNTCYHIVCVIVGACGNIVPDWYFATIIMHVYLLVALVEDAKDTLNRLMDENRPERLVRRQQIKLYHVHQEFCA